VCSLCVCVSIGRWSTHTYTHTFIYAHTYTHTYTRMYVKHTLEYTHSGKYRRNPEYALKSFERTLELRPDFSSAFAFMGHYNRSVLGDAGKAIDCYKRALSLNRSDREAGSALGGWASVMACVYVC